MRFWLCLRLGLFAVALSGLGCGAAQAPAPTSVKGRVFYRGQPLNGGLIVFVADEERGSHGSLVKAIIQADGAFALDPSPPAGWYRVAVAPAPTANFATPTVANPYPGLPSRYRNPLLSGLQGEIREGTDNSFEFQLDDARAERASD
jgi:hypothetical protein